MRKILVVDDSKTIRTLCEWIFKGLEDRILTADSAASARQVIASESPDVVLVDYTLPDEDSYEFVSSLTGTRVIMVGGTFAEFDEAKALEKGAMAVLIKPFKTAIFFETIEKVMAMEMGSASAKEPEKAEEPVIETETPEVTPAPSSGIHSSAQNFPKIHSSASISTSNSQPSVSSGSGVKRFNFPGSTSSPVIQPLGGDLSRTEGATPKTPVPSISPAIQGQNVQIDPAVIRSEVIAAVKTMLPAVVSSYLKKLIQAEVKPQLQTWVDTRVEALIKKMMQ